jgi:hypothetical protein
MEFAPVAAAVHLMEAMLELPPGSPARLSRRE